MIAALTIVGPTPRITRDKIKQLIPLINRFAALISAAMGYPAAKTATPPR
jgi:DNA-binding IclR family transcriptional regulator